ncbi:hypothetical protein SAMN05216548_12628 [Faunimonas pinastri]|uniref:Uncharacterized protein n=1 Tax=Faunimonas pinastri TaxID=1855383 RepID=A0A1H9QAH3_9HYPH|nr:hypothetical protein [Faunimonas pinastri]SER57440.1 hypothetical protein SAMN05216548_12628 [Faunimonas pinastri]
MPDLSPNRRAVLQGLAALPLLAAVGGAALSRERPITPAEFVSEMEALGFSYVSLRISGFGYGYREGFPDVWSRAVSEAETTLRRRAKQVDRWTDSLCDYIAENRPHL